MEESLFGKPYGLTYEEMIKSHHLFTATAKKTPYQLDLEVKDRKPDIVPKAGDKVKIKSREWYEKWKNSNGEVTGLGTHIFLPCMSECCGKTFEIKYFWGRFFSLKDFGKGWTMAMFEEVYPKESSKKAKCSEASESLVINASALEESLVASSAIPAINSVQGIGISYDLGTLSRQGAGLEAWADTSPRTNLPQSCFGRTSAIIHQDFLKDKEPELQTIKRHRFIKLEKL